jgi:hypothetical protein
LSASVAVSDFIRTQLLCAVYAVPLNFLQYQVNYLLIIIILTNTHLMFEGILGDSSSTPSRGKRNGRGIDDLDDDSATSNPDDSRENSDTQKTRSNNYSEETKIRANADADSDNPNANADAEAATGSANANGNANKNANGNANKNANAPGVSRSGDGAANCTKNAQPGGNSTHPQAASKGTPDIASTMTPDVNGSSTNPTPQFESLDPQWLVEVWTGICYKPIVCGKWQCDYI